MCVCVCVEKETSAYFHPACCSRNRKWKAFFKWGALMSACAVLCSFIHGARGSLAEGHLDFTLSHFRWPDIEHDIYHSRYLFFFAIEHILSFILAAIVVMFSVCKVSVLASVGCRLLLCVLCTAVPCLHLFNLILVLPVTLWISHVNLYYYAICLLSTPPSHSPYEKTCPPRRLVSIPFFLASMKLKFNSSKESHVLFF